MPLSLIQKHREHSIFLFKTWNALLLQGETLAPIILGLFTHGLKSNIHRKQFQVC